MALTGGADRVETASCACWPRSRARSAGVRDWWRSRASELAHRAGPGPAPPARAPGHARPESDDNPRNAEETASWARENGIHSLIVVTAGYHMPRAITELTRALPDVALHPSRLPPARQGRPGCTISAMLRLHGGGI